MGQVGIVCAGFEVGLGPKDQNLIDYIHGRRRARTLRRVVGDRWPPMLLRHRRLHQLGDHQLHACVHARGHVHAHACLRAHVRTCVCGCAHACVCAYHYHHPLHPSLPPDPTCMCTCVRVYIGTRAHVYMCTCVHMRTCVNACMLHACVHPYHLSCAFQSALCGVHACMSGHTHAQEEGAGWEAGDWLARHSTIKEMGPPHRLDV